MAFLSFLTGVIVHSVVLQFSVYENAASCRRPRAIDSVARRGGH